MKPDRQKPVSPQAVAAARAVAAAAATVSATAPLQYGGGAVLTHPAIYLVFWGPEWLDGSGVADSGGYSLSAARAYITSFFQGVGGSPWLNVVSQYCQGVSVGATSCAGAAASDVISNPAMQLRNSRVDPRTVPAHPNDVQLGFEALRGGQQAFHDDRAIYAVFTPPGKSTPGFNSTYCAYHAWYPNPLAFLPNHPLAVPYINMPYQPDKGASCWQDETQTNNSLSMNPALNAFGNHWFDGFSIIGGHEYAETITDPFNPQLVKLDFSLPYQGWVRDFKDPQTENGDICTNLFQPYATPYGNIQLGSHYFAVQSSWSNADSGCPLGYPRRLVLPALDNGSRFNTKAFLRNGGAPASVSVQYFDFFGNPAGASDGIALLPRNATLTVDQTLLTTDPPRREKAFLQETPGSAVVYSSQPITGSVLEQQIFSAVDSSSYPGVGSADTATLLYAPEIAVNAAAGVNTTIEVFNTSRVAAPVSIFLTDPAGASAGNVVVAVRPNGYTQLDISALFQKDFKGAATIGSAEGPIAATVHEIGTGGAVSTYLATSTGFKGTNLYVPQVMNGAGGGAGACQVTAVVAGGGNSYALRADGSLLAWGDNTYGQLGNGTSTGAAQPFGSFNPTPTPVLGSGGVGILVGMSKVAADAGHVLAIRGSDSTVWGWGRNSSGEVDGSAATLITSPVMVPGLAGVVAVAVGRYHSLALLGNGTVMAWGDNSSGQLGSNLPTGSRTPIPVSGLPAIKTILAGIDSNQALDNSGTLWAWGFNLFGELGTGAPYGTARAIPATVNLANPVSFSTGGHSMGADSSGGIWTWGINDKGELGFDPATVTESNVPLRPFGSPSGTTLAVTGMSASFALESDGTVWGWGPNNLKQLGTGFQDSFIPVKVPVANIKAVSSGYQHMLALDQAGQVWAWGDDRYGELGPNGAPFSGPVVVPCSGGSPPGPTSRIEIQSTSAYDGSVTVTYFDNTGTRTVHTFALPRLGRVEVDQGSPQDGIPASSVPSAAIIFSNVVMAAVVVEQISGGAIANAYNAIVRKPATVQVPLLENSAADGASTSLAIMNTGFTTVTVTVAYYDPATGAALTSNSRSVAPDTVWTPSQANDLPLGAKANAVVSAPGGSVAVLVIRQGTTQLATFASG